VVWRRALRDVGGLGASAVVGSATIDVQGNWPTYPTFTFYGPMVDPRVENETTGKRIELDYNLAANEVVTITTLFPHKQIVSSVNGDIYYSLTEDSDLASFAMLPSSLQDGESTIISVAGGSTSDESYIRMDWHDRYLGI